MKMPPTDTSVKPIGPRQGRWLVVLAAFAALLWSLPRPTRHDVVVESTDAEAPADARLAFRRAELLGELSGKGSLAEETELSGPCFGLDMQTLFFARSRTGTRADIVRSTFDGERWSKPEPFRELNSVDDDRHLTLSGDGIRAVFASNRSGGHGGFDLYETSNDGEQWRRPLNIGTTINSEAEEFDPALTPDGLTLYFVRAVPGSKADLFVTHRKSVETNWSSPQPVNDINLPDSHERSPAVSLDGQSLIFASNRSHRAGEPATFALFRAPLQGGGVGTPQRLIDGIASDADDLDAAFAPDGLSIVFASKRDGPKQLFLARGEFVVSRLAVSTTHLERFGPVKWGVPFFGLLLFVATWRWSRKARPIGVATPSVPKVVAPKRSEPPKNPLATWTASAEPVAPQPTPTKVNPLLTSASLPAAMTEPPVEEVKSFHETARPTRRRFAVALLVVAASLAIALRFDFWKAPQDSTDSPFVADARWLDMASFTDVATTRPIELPKLNRLDTARTAAPQPIVAPSNAVSLRPAARWPNDRAVVRSRSEVTRVAAIEPASQPTRLVALARRSLTAELTRPTARPAEVTALVSVAITDEKPSGVAPTITAKQDFTPPAAERTSAPPATTNHAALPKPNARVDLTSLPLSPVFSASNDPLRSLVRRGVSSRVVEPSSLAEPQALAGLVVVTSMESPLPLQSLTVPRVETPPIGQAVPAVAVRSLLAPSRAASSIAGTTIDPSISVARLPAKSSATSKVVPLTEEPALPAKDSGAENGNVPATLSPSRVESQGPQVGLVVATTNRIDAAMPRRLSRVDEVTSSDAVARSVSSQPSSQRSFRRPVIAMVAAESVAGPMPGNPTILLTSATMLVELLAPPQSAPLPRSETSGPSPSISANSLGDFTRWFSRTVASTMLESTNSAITPRSSAAVPALPRRERSLTPAEIPEDVK